MENKTKYFHLDGIAVLAFFGFSLMDLVKKKKYNIYK